MGIAFPQTPEVHAFEVLKLPKTWGIKHIRDHGTRMMKSLKQHFVEINSYGFLKQYNVGSLYICFY